MNEDNIFLQADKQPLSSNTFNNYSNPNEITVYPSESFDKGNCNGHFRSMASGGNGHHVGDKCGCDGDVPTVSIDFWVPILMAVALILIYRYGFAGNKKGR